MGYCHNQRKCVWGGRLPPSSFLMLCFPHELLLHPGWGCFLGPMWSHQDCHGMVEMNKKAVTCAKSGRSLRKGKNSNLFFWGVVLHGMWDLNSPTRDRDCNPSGGSRVLMLDHQGSPKSSNLSGPLACLGGPPDRRCRYYFLTQKCQPSSCRCPGHPLVCVFPKPSCVLFWALTSGWGPSLGTCSSCWRQALPESHLGSSYPSSPTYGTTGWRLFGVHGSL